MTDIHVAPEMWAPATQSAGAAEAVAAPSLTYWQDVRRRLWHNRPAMLGLGFIVFMVIAAIFGPIVSPHNYYEQDLKLSNIPPLFQLYEVTDSTGKSTRFFFNSGNLNLYEITPDGRVAGLIRGKKDLIKKQTVFTFGSEKVTLATATQTLTHPDGSALVPGPWQWNMSNLFGTDQLGRDVLARQLYGARISLTVALVATLVNFFIGVFYGGLSGYLGGRIDTLMMRIVEVISTIPLTLYVILIMVVFNSGFLSVIIAIGSVYWVDMARIVRGQILTLKQQDYVAAARTMGASTTRILVRHLLPNSVGPILVALTMLIPSAIFIESFMSFIGLGVTPPEASWGTLTSEAVETLRAYPYQMFFPAAAISLTMFAFNFLGDGLRDALDPRLRA